MTTYTKDQLRAMQAAGVPMQDNLDGPWAFYGPYLFDQDPSHYRPQPGFKFSGDIPRKLQHAGIELDIDEGGKWARLVGFAPRIAQSLYRLAAPAESFEPVANPAGRPICMRDEIDDLQIALAWAQQESDRWKREMDEARKERDEALLVSRHMQRRINEIQRILNG